MRDLPAGYFQFSDLNQEGDFLFTALQDDRFTEHAAWLAIIIGLWASVEEQFWFIYGALFKLDYERSKIAFYAIRSFHVRRNTVAAAISYFHSGSEIKTRWDALSGEITKCYRYRNSAAHAVWERNPRTGALRLKSTVVEGTFSGKEADYTTNNLRNQALEISKLAASLNQLALLCHKNP